MAEHLRTHRQNLGDLAPVAAELIEQIADRVGKYYMKGGDEIRNVALYLGAEPDDSSQWQRHVEAEFDR